MVTPAATSGTVQRTTLIASAMVFASASVWGLFWLPLREIDRHGLTGPWVILAINLVPLLFFVPIALRRWSIIRPHLKEASIIGALIAAGLVFYSLGLIYTSIMRATRTASWPWRASRTARPRTSHARRAGASTRARSRV